MSELYTFGGITIDTHTMTVERAGRIVPVSRREYNILVYLAKANGRPVPTTELVSEPLVFPKKVSPNAAEVYVKYIRGKLGEDAILTRRGFGYVIGGGRE